MVDYSAFGKFEYSSLCAPTDIDATYTWLDYPVDGSHDLNKCIVGGENIPVAQGEAIDFTNKCEVIVTVKTGTNVGT